MRRFVALILGALSVAGFVLFFPLTANAAIPERPLPPPGTGWQWGVPMTELSGNCAPTEFETAGGWSSPGRVFLGDSSAMAVPHPVRPIYGQLAAPCYVPGNSAQTRFNLVSIREAVAVSGANATIGCTSDFNSCFRSAAMGVGTPSSYPFNGTITCASTQWSQPSAQTIRSMDTNSNVGVNTAAGTLTYTLHVPANTSTAITTANCPYIVTISAQVSSYSLETGTATPTRTVTGFVWSAERYYRQQAYTPFDPLVSICLVAPDSNPDCSWIATGSQPDGTDFNVVCAGAPIFSWGDWDWLPYAIGHYAECLFNPLNGWDRSGVARGEWEARVLPFYDTLSALFTSWYGLYEGCGVIFNYDLYGTPLVVDTCTLGWITPFKDFWRIIITVLSIWGIAIMASGMVTSIFRGKSLKKDEADE